MKTIYRQKRATHSRDLALAIFGTANADDVRMQRVIDRHIARVLDAADNNLSLAANLLGIHRRRCSDTRGSADSPLDGRRDREQVHSAPRPRLLIFSSNPTTNGNSPG
jgi:hypothetical protein